MPEENNEYFAILNGDNVKDIYFYNPITYDSTFTLVTNLQGVIKEFCTNTTLGFKSSLNNEEYKKYNIVLHLNCTGGPVDLAFLISDVIKNSPIKITAVAEGIVASSGLIVFLSCPERMMLKHSKLYMHETIHSFNQVEYGDMKKYYYDSADVNKTVKDFYTEHTNLSYKMVDKFFKQNMTLDYFDALTFGFINKE